MNENNNHYIAITIGPIGDMMGMVRKPAALWGTSYIFSYISKHLCELIVENEVATYKNIITPFFVTKDNADKETTPLVDRHDGVGLFHDHIIVRASLSENLEKMKEIKRQVLNDVAKILAPASMDTTEKFNAYVDQIEEYIMIAICGFEKEGDSNAIMYCGKQLDSLELPKHFAASEKKHPILSRLQNSRSDNEANATVKEIAKRFGVNMTEWQLTFENKEDKSVRDVRDLPDIAASSNAPGFKKNKYYCVLRSDGDNVGKIIASLSTDEECREFSKTCLKYCSDVAKAVKAYGGVTIYAGGDDLFALVPCQGLRPKTQETITVLEFTQVISQLFLTKFKTYIDDIKENNKKLSEDKRVPIPSLSFGAFICYSSFPLYEAIERSGALLFGVAKNTKHKNCVAVHLQKHAGQSEELVISNCVLEDKTNRFFERFNFLNENAEDQDEMLLSAANKILLFRELLKASPENAENIFKNIFDADFHQDTREDFLQKFLPDMYRICCQPNQILLYEHDVLLKSKDSEEKLEQQDDTLKPADPAKTLAQLIRFMKFYVEKGDM